MGRDVTLEQPLRGARGLVVAVACLLAAGGGAHAEQLLYSLDIPDGQAVTFEVPFWIEYPGEISVRAEWSGNRPLAFRIEPPGHDGVAARRSGPSPILLRMDVRPNQLRQGPWTLRIHALPLSGAGEGRLTINVPDRESIAAGESASKSMFPPEPEPEIEEWQEPRDAGGELNAEQKRLVRSTESFRKLLVDSKNRAPDTCRWQDDLLRWLAAQRDLAIDEDHGPDPATGKLMTRMANVIRTVDEVRTSEDPVLIGPAPTDRAQRIGWERLRNKRLRPVERSLDELMTAVQRDHAPELEGEQWPLRMVSCLTATERYFDERWVSGADRAPNRDLAEAQWRPLNHAAAALEALAALAAEDVIRLRTRN